MAKASFFSTEPLFFKGIYILAALGTLYVIYENIFVEEENHSGLTIYLLVLFGFYHLRRSTVVLKLRKSQKDK